LTPYTPEIYNVKQLRLTQVRFTINVKCNSTFQTQAIIIKVNTS